MMRVVHLLHAQASPSDLDGCSCLPYQPIHDIRLTITYATLYHRPTPCNIAHAILLRALDSLTTQSSSAILGYPILHFAVLAPQIPILLRALVSPPYRHRPSRQIQAKPDLRTLATRAQENSLECNECRNYFNYTYRVGTAEDKAAGKARRIEANQDPDEHKSWIENCLMAYPHWKWICFVLTTLIMFIIAAVHGLQCFVLPLVLLERYKQIAANGRAPKQPRKKEKTMIVMSAKNQATCIGPVLWPLSTYKLSFPSDQEPVVKIVTLPDGSDKRGVLRDDDGTPLLTGCIRLDRVVESGVQDCKELASTETAVADDEVTRVSNAARGRLRNLALMAPTMQKAADGKDEVVPQATPEEEGSLAAKVKPRKKATPNKTAKKGAEERSDDSGSEERVDFLGSVMGCPSRKQW